MTSRLFLFWHVSNMPVNWLELSSSVNQGLTLAHFKAQLEDLRYTSLTLELKLSTSRTHSRVIWVTWGTKLA